MEDCSIVRGPQLQRLRQDNHINAQGVLFALTKLYKFYTSCTEIILNNGLANVNNIISKSLRNTRKQNVIVKFTDSRQHQ